MAPVDLYLGSDIGRWVLQRVGDSPSVGRIVTAEPDWPLPANAPFRPQGDLALSVHWPRLFSPSQLSSYRAVYNLHPGYLPYGRGYYPMFWALYEHAPAGATLHKVDDGIDTGPIVERVEVEYVEEDTGDTIYPRVRAAEQELFLAHWPTLAAGLSLQTTPQQGRGSYHSRAEFTALIRNPSAKQSPKVQRCLLHPHLHTARST